MNVVEKPVSEYQVIPVDLIVVQSNTRKESGFEESEIASLAESIRQQGILQPLMVRPLTGQHGTVYALVLGERRLRAAKMIGLDEVPCRVLDIDAKDVMELQITENLQRVDLSPLEEAQALADYIWEKGVTQAEAGRRFGKNQSWVSQRLALLELSDEAKTLISRGIIKASHAEVLKSYEKTAPLAVEKVVKEMAESGKAVPVAELAEKIQNQVHWYQKVIQGEGYVAPRFDISECLSCQKTSRLKNRYAGTDGISDDATVLYCANGKCYAKKERAALKAEEQAFLEAHPGAVLLSGRRYGTYEEFWTGERHRTRLAECRAEGCQNLKDGYHRIDPNAKPSVVCLDPECWRQKDRRDARNRDEAAKKQHGKKVSAWSRIGAVKEARSAIAALPERVSVWVVGNLLLDALSSVWWRPGGGMWVSAAAKVIGWPEKGFAPESLRDQHWGKFAQHLEALPGERLVELIDIIAACYFASGRAPSLDYLAGRPEERSEPLGHDQQADCVVV